MTDDAKGPPRIDSRRWTGRGLGPTRAERRAVWRTFRSAAGRAATAPRRAAAIGCGIGGVLVPPAIAAVSPDHLPALASRLHGAVAHAVGPDGAPLAMRWLAEFAGPASAIVLAASLAGAASAWRNRDALARGFAAVPADRLEGGGGDVAIGLVAMVVVIRNMSQPSLSAILALWMLAYFLARGMTLMAERLFAAPDGRGWMAAQTVIATLALAALLVASAYR